MTSREAVFDILFKDEVQAKVICEFWRSTSRWKAFNCLRPAAVVLVFRRRMNTVRTRTAERQIIFLQRFRDYFDSISETNSEYFVSSFPSCRRAWQIKNYFSGELGQAHWFLALSVTVIRKHRAASRPEWWLRPIQIRRRLIRPEFWGSGFDFRIVEVISFMFEEVVSTASFCLSISVVSLWNWIFKLFKYQFLSFSLSLLCVVLLKHISGKQYYSIIVMTIVIYLLHNCLYNFYLN